MNIGKVVEAKIVNSFEIDSEGKKIKMFEGEIKLENGETLFYYHPLPNFIVKLKDQVINYEVIQGKNNKNKLKIVKVEGEEIVNMVALEAALNTIKILIEKKKEVKDIKKIVQVLSNTYREFLLKSNNDKEDRIIRSNALKRAVEYTLLFSPDIKISSIIELAKYFYQLVKSNFEIEEEKKDDKK